MPDSAPQKFETPPAPCVAQQQKTAIRGLFTHIAAQYDLVNRVISLGQDQRWRKAALALAALPPGGRLLDVATGTGDVALSALRQYPGRRIVGMDLTPAMVRLAQEKAAGQPVSWGISDGLALPFPANTFDAVISAFMLRNVPDVTRALAEQLRVARPGGRVICLELTWPTRWPMSWLFNWYFFGWTPLVGSALSGDVAAYRYLPRSVVGFIAPETLAEIMRSVGLTAVSWQTQMLGTVAIHVGQK